MSLPAPPKMYGSFAEGLSDIRQATSSEEISAIVGSLNEQFEAGTLEISPEQWAQLSSAVLCLPL